MTDPSAAPPAAAPPYDRRMLEALICPVSQGPLTWDAGRGELVSALAHLAFPVRDGIPIMLVSEARNLERSPVKLRLTKRRAKVDRPHPPLSVRLWGHIDRSAAASPGALTALRSGSRACPHGSPP